jgi:methyl-accepting chemotaxis protein
MWTFQRKITVGFALAFILLAAIGTISYSGTNRLMQTSDWVTHTHQVVEDVANLMSLLKDEETGQRGYVITRNESYLDDYHAGTEGVARVLSALRQLTSDNPHQQTRLDRLAPLVVAKEAELNQTIELCRKGDQAQTLKIVNDGGGKRFMDQIREIAAQMESEERELLKRRADEAEVTASTTRRTIIFGTLVCLLLLLSVAGWITRSLSRQIGEAVSHVQNSSTELQSTANQQATGARETASVMNEVTTTMNELLVTFRQISESAQQVAHMAQQTATAARGGDETVAKTQEAIAGIRRQVDVIVGHMLDLGKKSQQIGGILDIINELAEQTNILSINATIEAAGAGEAGNRFAVVGDEIRKLSERVTGSTREIRGLIEEVRAAVNTTVLATEVGSKAVDAGLQHFAEVTRGFKQIASLVVTSTEAAREIEISTKQQMTAVEQVNTAIKDAAEATRETEASTTQTLQTATQLAHLSQDLSRIVKPLAKAASA